MTAAEFAALLESALKDALNGETPVADVQDNSTSNWHKNRNYGGLTVQLESGQRFVIEIRPALR